MCEGSGHEPGVGSRGCEGFTLIELMVVTMIIGLLAAGALPRFDSARERTQFAAIQQDLRNLGASQERYYQGETSYALDLDDLDFEASNGVEVVVQEATSQGWSAMATHVSLPAGRGCAIYLGNALPPPVPGGGAHSGDPGVIECSDD